MLSAKSFGHLLEPTRLGMLKWCDAIAIGQRTVSPSGEQGVKCGLVIRATIAKHHRLHDSRPVQIVNVIERRARIDQTPYHLGMTEMRRGDQRSAEVGARHEARIVAQFDGERQQVGIVRYCGDRHDVVGPVFEGVHVGSGLGQSAQRLVLRGESRHMGWRPAPRVTGMDISALRDQAFDPGDIALVGGPEEAVISRDFACRGGGLRRDRAGEADEKSNQGKTAHGSTFLGCS